MKSTSNSGGNGKHGGWGGGVARREFMQRAGVAGAGLAWMRFPSLGATPDRESWDQYIPAEKGLRPAWVSSLFERGGATTYAKSRGELKYLGMPVGGICCGTLYLGGDGRLWNWDVFNQKTEGVLPRRVSWADVGMDFQTGDSAIRPRDGATYVKPAVQADSQAIAQGFAVRVQVGEKVQTRALDASAWPEVTFTGQYPVGTVRYLDDAFPVGVSLEAYSPFIPLRAEDSSLPATIFRFTVRNTGPTAAHVAIAGWLENATCFHSARPSDGQRVNEVRRRPGVTLVSMRFEPTRAEAGSAARPDLVVEDFEAGYRNWTVEGDAFGGEPASRSTLPSYQGDVGGEGAKVVNSHATAPGGSVGDKDAKVGRLVSAPFRIQRRFLSFYVGGGRGEDVGLHLKVGTDVVRSAVGHDGNRMRRDAWDVAEFEGREAVIEIVDQARGAWGNIGVDQLVQTDAPQTDTPVDRRLDFGTLALGVVGEGGGIRASTDLGAGPFVERAFLDGDAGGVARRAAPRLVGSVGREVSVAAGATVVLHFVLAWHFPHSELPVPDARTGNHYAARFADADAVVGWVVSELGRLEAQTFRWRDTWYDSTLPHWFLERTFSNTSILATTTAHRFASGRFWAWEGIGCCEGTCTHVWHYAQAMGRLFPEIERDVRERVDFGVGFETATGVVRHRAEGTGPAVDGQCGRILGVWREHQMSSDGAFLARVWPRVKLAVEYLLRHDRDGDGILDGAQENTLDAAWYGQIAWITSLSLAAFRAAEEMAREQGDADFAARCRERFEKARASVENKLFNGEYFIQIPDPTREKSLGTYEACHIDQVHGQSWAWQVTLGRVLDREKTLSALRALWKYNFAPDVGPFRKKYTAGRPYALPGDAGLVMTSNPRLVPNVYGLPSWQIGYFNECMSGFEHQAASHMMAEGMVMEALAITRAIHDRYHGARRNPFNEIECSDHYARAMASYGTFVTACGYEYHGPSGRLGFAPRLTPERFRAAFTAAEGWGTFSQAVEGEIGRARLDVRFGRLRLRELVLGAGLRRGAGRVVVRVAGEARGATVLTEGDRARIRFEDEVLIREGESLEVELLAL
ncbi:MAG: hypothetical protein IT580_11725 [Verrucomicrobiales bacterium]|nr:hypothetical protein [Verrucomicrobiales bacterium]